MHHIIVMEDDMNNSTKRAVFFTCLVISIGLGGCDDADTTDLTGGMKGISEEVQPDFNNPLWCGEKTCDAYQYICEFDGIDCTVGPNGECLMHRHCDSLELDNSDAGYAYGEKDKVCRCNCRIVSSEDDQVADADYLVIGWERDGDQTWWIENECECVCKYEEAFVSE